MFRSFARNRDELNTLLVTAAAETNNVVTAATGTNKCCKMNQQCWCLCVSTRISLNTSLGRITVCEKLNERLQQETKNSTTARRRRRRRLSARARWTRDTASHSLYSIHSNENIGMSSYAVFVIWMKKTREREKCHCFESLLFVEMLFVTVELGL